MDEDLRGLVSACAAAAGAGNGLTAGAIEQFCSKHQVTAKLFYDLFARHVALEFMHGELSYADADSAMNDLSGMAAPCLEGFAQEVYLAFDAGEYFRAEDSAQVIPWQKYTLPLVREALRDE